MSLARVGQPADRSWLWRTGHTVMSEGVRSSREMSAMKSLAVVGESSVTEGPYDSFAQNMYPQPRMDGKGGSPRMYLKVYLSAGMLKKKKKKRKERREECKSESSTD